jgi:hypothetical protein
MAIFKIDTVELSGSLIKSGRFQEAIPLLFQELDEAHGNGVITHDELMSIQLDFCRLLLKPDAKNADWLGTKMLHLAVRIPGKIKKINEKNETN